MLFPSFFKDTVRKVSTYTGGKATGINTIFFFKNNIYFILRSLNIMFILLLSLLNLHLIVRIRSKPAVHCVHMGSCACMEP